MEPSDCGPSSSSSSVRYNWNYRGVSIDFPYDPYVTQKTYTERVVDSILDRNNALLESPTGTGKTLALLCGAISTLVFMKLSGSTASRIVYASRTHSQLAQVVSQLKYVDLHGMKAVVLGSREQLCLNPKVMDKPSSGEKVTLCNALVKAKRCEFHNNFSQTDTTFESEVCDIEDLVKKNRVRKICPYYKSRDLAGQADLVFLPYNYLLDVSIRSTLAVNLLESVVILDEAHNVMKTCEESASLAFESQDVAVAINEVDTVIKLLEKELESDLEVTTELQVEDVFLIKETLSNLEEVISKEVGSPSMAFEKTYPGDLLCGILHRSGFTLERNAPLSGVMQSVLDTVHSLQVLGGRESGKGLSKILSLLKTVYLNATDQTRVAQSMNAYFRIFIRKCTRHKNNSIFDIWCFHPGFSMLSLQMTGVRSIILTSGTLKPFSSFAQELEIQFVVQFTGGHVINKDQILVRTMGKGMSDVDLISTYQNRSNMKYLSSLGNSLTEIAKLVPNGMLVFFPSYSVMDHCVQHWQSCGIWTQMTRFKAMFVEPKFKTEFLKTIGSYRQAVEEKSGSSNGSCLFAVCRGKVSEGIDFADKAARAVILIGIPFPSLYDPKVKAKKEYVDERRKSNKLQFSGQDWYKLEAYRAINQAIGRVIRHKNDFGAIIFLDKRFGDDSVNRELSDWVSSGSRKSPSFAEGLKELRTFFGNNSGSSSFKAAMPSLALKSSSSTSSGGATAGLSRSAKRPGGPGEDDGQVKINKPKKISIKGAASNVLKYKVTNIVLRLKDRLTKAELVSFKEGLKIYKETKDMKSFLDVTENMFHEQKIFQDELVELKTFIRGEDLKDYESFMGKLQGR